MDSGLEGVVAAQTVLSHSDGGRGVLWVRGHTLDELVADYGYEGDGRTLVGRVCRGRARPGERPRDARRGPGGSLRQALRLARRRFAAAVSRRRAPGAGGTPRGEPAGGDPRDVAGGDRGLDQDKPRRAGAAARSRRSRPRPICCAWCMAIGSRRRWRRRSTPISPRFSKTGLILRPLPRASSPRPAPRFRLPCSAPIAPLPGHCMAGRRDRHSTCSTRRRRAATSTPGSSASLPPASG